MTKYTVGDVLEITGNFHLEGASYSRGEKYAITEVEGNRYYYLESDECYYTNTISEVDAHPGFRKVEPKSETQKALDELKEKLKPENTLAVDISEPETIPVDALREALDFLGIQEVFDTENIISLAKRLS